MNCIDYFKVAVLESDPIDSYKQCIYSTDMAEFIGISQMTTIPSE